MQTAPPAGPSLNEPQRQAIIHGDGPLLTFAGAGSGKTRVLTARIAHLISSGRATPEQILALTFTNKAAKEMRSRLATLMGGQAPKGIWIGTFHAIAVRMMRPEVERLGYRSGFSIFDEDDQRALVKRALADLELDPKRHPAGPILAAISRAKSELQSPDDLRRQDPKKKGTALVYERYQQLSRESGGMDFDDILNNLVALLREHEDVRRSWRERFTHILVDEYQDTNRVQYELLRLLTGERKNLTVVGDDDQSIYAFRGADVRNILDFQRDYPDATVIKLEQNYRSSQSILDAAHHVISRNPQRSPKRLWSDLGPGLRPVLVLAADDDQEAGFVAREIETLARAERRPHSDFAILYRTNAQSRAFEKALVEQRIPYNLVGGLKFWDRREIKDMVAYLRLLQNPSDAVSFDRIANVPKRRISEKTTQAAIAAASDSGVSILDMLALPEQVPVRDDARQALARFRAEVAPIAQAAATRPPSELVQLLIRYCNLGEHYDDGSRAGEARMQNLDELKGLAADYDRLKPPRGLERFLTDIALTSEVDDLDDQRSRVTLITLHMAKGLEFPVVFLTGLEEKTLPHERAFQEPRGLEEERRLLYVGITRARTHLYMTAANVRHLFGKASELAPSSFLSDLPKGAIDLVELEGHRSHGAAARLRGTAEAP